MKEASLANGLPGSNLWRSVGKLLRLRGVILVSGFRRAKLRGKIGAIALGLLLLAGLGVAFVLSWLFLRFLRTPLLAQYLGDTRVLLENVPVLVLSAAFVGILLTSFGVLLQALYLAGDMDFLLSAPLPIRAIFITKLLQAILPNFGLILLFGLPVLYGLGASAGYNALYYPLVLILLASLALAAAGLASLLVMAVVRVFPARRVAEVLGFVVGIAMLICSQSGQLANFSQVSPLQASQAFNLMGRFNAPWSPLTWAGRGLMEIGAGRWLTGSGLLLLTIGLAGGVFALSLVSAERLYYSGWASVQVSPRKKGKPRSAHPGVQPTRAAPVPLAALNERLVPRDVQAIVAKDFLMLRRDLRNMSGLITPLVFGVFYAFMLIRNGGQPPAGRGEAPPAFTEMMKNLMVYGNVGISLFVSWSLLSRLATMGFSQEGKHYWMLKAAPAGPVKLLTAKYLVAVLPTLALGWGFLLVISLVQRASLSLLAFSLAVVTLSIVGTAGLNLAFGVVGANFNWEDPRRISQGSIGCLGMLASFGFLGVSLVLFFGPALLLRMVGGPQWVGQLVGMVLGGTLCLAGAFIPPWLVRKRVARLAEE